jgi:hypothetical protein
MNPSTRAFHMAIVFSLATAALAAAQTTAPATMPRTIYVQDFEAHTGDAARGSTPRRGPLSFYAACARAKKP